MHRLSGTPLYPHFMRRDARGMRYTESVQNSFRLIYIYIYMYPGAPGHTEGAPGALHRDRPEVPRARRGAYSCSYLCTVHISAPVHRAYFEVPRSYFCTETAQKFLVQGPRALYRVVTCNLFK